MNKEVANAIKNVVKSWQAGDRNYTFETRGIKFCKPLPGTGEYICVFFLRVEGFYTDSSLLQPIDLNFTSQNFITKNLNEENPENSKGDANRLSKFLETFTKDSYDKIKTEIENCPNPYTSDLLYWE